MREKKRVFKHYPYRECDAFAEYLQAQAQQGWHFREWKMGLVFENGIPAAVHYEVEVFPDGTEMDTKPEPETEEYAEYCEAAGWKLIDSKRKFCIFRRERPDALPIVTPEERFENIKRAELRSWFHSELGVVILAALNWFQFLELNFRQWIFNDMMLFVLFAVTFAALKSILNLIAIFVWAGKVKRQLSDGAIPVYGSRGKRYFAWRWYWAVIYCIAVCVLAWYKGFGNSILLLPVFAGGLLLLSIMIEIFRPARADNWLIQLAGESGLLIFFIIVMLAVMFSGDSGERQNAALQEFPLVQTDYRDMEGKVEFTDAGELNGLLGTERYYRIEYTLGDAAGEDNQDDNTDYLSYDIYNTEYPWILNKLWKEEVKNLSDSKINPDDWNAVSAYHIGDGYYRILYEDTLLIFSADLELDRAQIQIVREKLNLP